jgi:hypothetical protein
MDASRLAEHVQVLVAQDITECSNGSKVRFLRVEVKNVEPAVESIIQIIADTSWVSGLVDDLTKQGFLACAKPTIEKLSNDLARAIDNEVAADVGEYVVSVVARHVIETQYGYNALPLAEIIKEKISGNPGFDYHHEKDNLLLIFGEAKYKTGVNAYGSAFGQIVDFIQSQKDLKEINTLSYFISDDTKTNLANGKKGYSAAFSTKNKSFDGETLVKNIKQNVHFNALLKQEELLIVAVDVND